MTTKTPIAELSADTSLLVARLSKAEPGETITYTELSAVIGRDIRGRQGYQRLQSARRIVQRENRIVFATVCKEGIRRCDDAGIVDVAGDVATKIHKASHKGIKLLSAVTYDKLSNTERIKFNTTVSQLGVLHQVTTATAIKKLTNAVEKAGDKLPLATTLEQFK